MKSAPDPLQSENLPGGFGGGAPAPTIVDLCKPSDINLIHQAVVNGWNVPQHTRDQISEQLCPALDFHGRRAEQGDRRAPTRILKLVKLAMLMDVSNDVEAGLRKSLHPLGRSRRPEQRKPRRLSNHDTAQELERMLEKLAATHPELAASIRASTGHSEN